MSENNVRTTDSFWMKASARRREARSPRLPSVIIFSTKVRISLALGSVVSMRSCSRTEVTSERYSARRWLLLRPRARPALRWRMSGHPLGFGLGLHSDFGLAPFRRHQVFDVHAEGQAHFVEQFFDLVERLAAEVFGFEHFVFGLLHQVRDGLDVRVLEAVGRPHRQLQLVDAAEQIAVQVLAGLFGYRNGHRVAFVEVD